MPKISVFISTEHYLNSDAIKVIYIQPSNFETVKKSFSFMHKYDRSSTENENL